MNKEATLKVAYFSNQFADRHGHGLARYARQLYEALVRHRSKPEISPIAAWSSLQGEDLKQLIAETGLTLLPWGRRFTPLAWAMINAPEIERWIGHSHQLLHGVALGYPIATRLPYAVTIHDIGPLTHPQYFPKKNNWIIKRSLAQAARQARALICVSAATANEVEDYLGNSVQDRLHVIPEGISSPFLNTGRVEPFGIAQTLQQQGIPYILTTGKISPRKNIAGIIEALGLIADKIPHHLISVGGEGWDTDELKRKIIQSKLERRLHFCGYVNDEQLRSLYTHASAYVHPSLFEGFGLTVLEAMACGCPVVTSNVYSLPEVAGDAALLVNPNDSGEIAEAIHAICTDSVTAAELTVRGHQRAGEFSWDTCAERVLDVYQAIV